MKNTYKKFLNVIMILVAQNSFANKFEINLDSIGKKNLKLPNGISVSIVDFDEQEFETHRSWKSRIIIKDDSKVIIEKYPIIKDYDESYNFFLVPIKKGKYVMDLDNNNDYEFAVAVEHEGNAPATSATVFSLKGSKLQVYKHAWYQQENGQEVIWDYEKAPKKNIFTSHRVSEPL